LGFADGQSLLKHHVSTAGPSIETECRVNLDGVVGRKFEHKTEMKWQDAGEKFSN
jgi:hypothetical protein